MLQTKRCWLELGEELDVACRTAEEGGVQSEQADGNDEEAWHRKVDAEKESKTIAKVGEVRSHRT